jgi:hypothetical protein
MQPASRGPHLSLNAESSARRRDDRAVVVSAGIGRSNMRIQTASRRDFRHRTREPALLDRDDSNPMLGILPTHYLRVQFRALPITC